MAITPNPNMNTGNMLTGKFCEGNLTLKNVYINPANAHLSGEEKSFFQEPKKNIPSLPSRSIASPLKDLSPAMANNNVTFLSPSVLPFAEKAKIFSNGNTIPTPVSTPNPAVKRGNVVADGNGPSPSTSTMIKPLQTIKLKRAMSSPNTLRGRYDLLAESERSICSDGIDKENTHAHLIITTMGKGGVGGGGTIGGRTTKRAADSGLNTFSTPSKLPSERTGRTLESARKRYDTVRNTAGRLGLQGNFSEPPKRLQHGWTGANFISPKYTHINGKRVFDETRDVKHQRQNTTPRIEYESGSYANRNRSRSAGETESELFANDLQDQLEDLYEKVREDEEQNINFARDLQVQLTNFSEEGREEVDTQQLQPQLKTDVRSPDAATTASRTSITRRDDGYGVPTCAAIVEDEDDESAMEVGQGQSNLARSGTKMIK
mmetsp:Transcript_13119/g.28906  ORF Transcript_13119/g.28906 Transcript_13119/m.28906 type:complete len:433 (-) Transcript_13119:950-2248(-)